MEPEGYKFYRVVTTRKVVGCENPDETPHFLCSRCIPAGARGFIQRSANFGLYAFYDMDGEFRAAIEREDFRLLTPLELLAMEGE